MQIEILQTGYDIICFSEYGKAHNTLHYHIEEKFSEGEYYVRYTERNTIQYYCRRFAILAAVKRQYHNVERASPLETRVSGLSHAKAISRLRKSLFTKTNTSFRNCLLIIQILRDMPEIC